MSAGWQVAVVVLAACVVALAVLLVSTMRQVGVISLSLRPTDQGRGPLMNAPAPALAGIDARSGDKWKLRGRDAQVLLFLSLHCESCRTLVTAVNAFAADRPDVSVAACIPGSREDARQFVALTGLDVVTLSDHDTQAFALYNVSFTPHAIAIDASGRVTATTPVRERADLDQLAPRPNYPRPERPVGSNAAEQLMTSN